MSILDIKISEINPSDFTIMNNLLVDLLDILTQLKTSTKSQSMVIESINAAIEMSLIYDKLDKLNSMLLIIIDKISNKVYIKAAIVNMSYTFSKDVKVCVVAIKELYDKYHKADIEDDVLYFNSIAATTFVKDNLEELYNLVLASSSNKLINYLTLSMLDKVSDVQKNILFTRIETQKNAILNTKRVQIRQLQIGVQSRMITYGLTPYDTSLPLNTFLKEYGVKSIIDLSLKQHGVVLMNSSSRSPIEFDVRSLIDDKYIAQHSLKIHDSSGLSEKVIEKYNTSIDLGKSSILPEYTKIYIEGNEILDDQFPSYPDLWYIIETINGTHYRFLVNERSKQAGSKLVSSKDIEGLLKGCSTRSTDYNNIMTSDIVKNYSDINMGNIVLDYKNKTTQETSDIIKTKIVDKLTAGFTKAFIELQTTRPKHTIDDIKDINIIPLVQQTVLSVLITTDTSSTIKKASSSEYMLTYLFKYNDTLTAMTKEVKYRWYNTKIDASIYKEYDKETANKKITEMFMLVVSQACNELDKNKMWTLPLSLKQYYFINQ
jgi:hypothetical protein